MWTLLRKVLYLPKRTKNNHKMSYLQHTVLVVCLTYLIPKISEYLLSPSLPLVTEGHVHPDFKRVKDTFQYMTNLDKSSQLQSSGHHHFVAFRTVEGKFVTSERIKGGSFAVYYKGEWLVDLWGGYADEQSKAPWKKDTITIIHSSTKGIASILVAKMVENGWLDYDKPVSYYWPNFAKNGKENITVKILLSHQGGLSSLNQTLSMKMIKSEPTKLEQILESSKPLWTPGTDFAYHALTFGFFVDNLIMKADPKHRQIDQIFREEIAKPYGLDLMISAPFGENYRVARMNPITLNDFILGSLLSLSQMKIAYNFLKPNSIIMKSSTVLKEMMTPAVFNDPSIRELPLSSNMGFGNARSIAKLYGILANKGKMRNKTLLSTSMIQNLATEQFSGTSKDLGIHVSMAKGVFIVNNTKEQPVFGHPGYGGQMAFADVHNEIGMAYVTNHLSIYAFGNDPNFLDLQRVFYECFDKFKSRAS